MKRFKYVLPILAVMIAVVAAFAFKTKPVVADHQVSYYYFKYIPTPTSAPAEGDYENDANWSNLPTYVPESSPNPCPNGTDMVCVLRATQSSINSQSGANLAEKLENFLIAQSSAVTYVTTPSNVLTKKDFQ